MLIIPKFLHSLFSYFAEQTCFAFCADVHQRRQEAKRVGWRKNNAWFEVVHRYQGHKGRAAFALLEYEPRYHSFIKRRTGEVLMMEEPVLALTGVEN